jgi:hypothetical protein
VGAKICALCQINRPQKISAKAGIQWMVAKYDLPRLIENLPFSHRAMGKVGGVLTLLWHPNHIIKPDWLRLYLRTLDQLKGRMHGLDDQCPIIDFDDILNRWRTIIKQAFSEVPYFVIRIPIHKSHSSVI